VFNLRQSRIGSRDVWWLAAIAPAQTGGDDRECDEHLRAIPPGVFAATLPVAWRTNDAERYRALRLIAFPVSNVFGVAPALRDRLLTGGGVAHNGTECDRTTPTILTAAIREAIAAIDADLAIRDSPGHCCIAKATNYLRTIATLLNWLATLGLGLGAAGRFQSGILFNGH
jgi:hypothetical protein